MHVSYAELMRIAPEALRALGLSFGEADGAVEGLVWTECVLGVGYAALRAAEQQRIERGWVKPRVVRQGTRPRLDFAGAPLLLYAARVSDLVRTTAPGDAVTIHGASGKLAVPYIAHHIGCAGLSTAILWRGGNRVGADAEPVIAVCTPSQSLCVAPVTAFPRLKHLPNSGFVDVREIDGLLGMFAETGDDVTIVATRHHFVSSAGALGEALAHRVGLGKSLAVVDVHGGLSAAVQHGLQVPQRLHQVLTTLASRLRLPSSERSRAQAG
jgi:hypothetical protein